MFDIITIGGASKDVYFRSKKFSLRKDSRGTGVDLCVDFGSKIDVHRVLFETGGGGTNTAVSFARLGFKTACISKIGKDSAGKHILEELRQEKINTSLMIQTASKRTECATGYSAILEHPKSGERTILVYRGANGQIKTSDILFSKLNARWMYIAPLSEKSMDIIAPLVRSAKKKGMNVAMNPSKSWLQQGIKKCLPVLKQLDVLLLNREEASILTGIPYANDAAIFACLRKNVPGIVVMTEGKNGVRVCDQQYVYHAGVYHSNVVDTLGAGDSFGSGFVAGLLNGKSIPECIEFGSLNATSVLRRIGAKDGLLKKAQIVSFKRSLKQLKITTYVL